jgi:hypothetical protein
MRTAFEMRGHSDAKKSREAEWVTSGLRVIRMERPRLQPQSDISQLIRRGFPALTRS